MLSVPVNGEYFGHEVKIELMKWISVGRLNIDHRISLWIFVKTNPSLEKEEERLPVTSEKLSVCWPCQ